MLNVREVISEYDRELINIYRDRYAPIETVRSSSVPFEDVLSDSWAHHKESLYEQFGKKLIVSKEIEFHASPMEMGGELSRRMDRDRSLGEFINAVYDERWKTSYPSDEYTFWRNIVNTVDYTTLFTEIYRGPDLSIKNPKDADHPLKFKPGIKIMKMLRKVAEAFDLPGYEKLRLEVSRIIGQTKQSGELCLSIHPMDYMTMSDNECDWESCMNWRDAGCYRRGTVEMMNSPYVIVAYLRSSDDMYVPGGYWNNKKWRTLLIQHPDAIISVKAYPFEHDDLTKEAINMLTEFTSGEYEAEQGAFYQYFGDGFYSSHSRADSDKRVYSFRLTTGAMYNDFGCTQSGHYIVPSKTYLANPEPKKIFYSGDTQCVWCGGIAGDGRVQFAEEEHLLCYDCGESGDYVTCPECGCELDSEDDIIWVDDCGYCECCIGDHCGWDVWNERYVHYDNLGSLFLVNDKMRPGAIDISIKLSTLASLQRDGIVQLDEEEDEYYITADTVRNNTYGIRFSLWDLYSDKAVNDYLTRII